MPKRNQKPFGRKALTFDKDKTTMLYGREIRADENKYMLYYYHSRTMDFLCREKLHYSFHSFLGSQGMNTTFYFYIGSH